MRVARSDRLASSEGRRRQLSIDASKAAPGMPGQASRARSSPVTSKLNDRFVWDCAKPNKKQGRRSGKSGFHVLERGHKRRVGAGVRAGLLP